ncbi:MULTISPECIES: hypothetical protein [unclassified Methanoregula]|uniref:hypothetical protein n=1 Tax=unclassified Methanoregula TaxID=2649730 RepID=UPI0009D61926|nr:MULTISPECIES: hypothetical protein [unclassified Methanoregula]OPX65348.1 MAG: hypothetical protein A4E33_00381 [Methanoregula sp. PtaB.Bin085]OPY32257.1 MAG: hypothetical protein A4E34_02631 [Methanoregula sp. PtaU1.Bin006]
MEPRKISIALLALLLAAMAMVPCVSAAEQNVNESGVSHENIGKNAPEHYIPPEYFKDAKPPTPLPESEMINLIISEKTIEKSALDNETGIINLPTAFLDLKAQFTESKGYSNRFTENGLKPEERVVLVRMPHVMYDRFLAASDSGNLTLPASNFARYYTNLADLESHIKLEGVTLRVSPGEEDAKMLERMTSLPAPIPTPMTVSSGNAGIGTNALLTPPGANTWHNEWIHFNRINFLNTYDYCIGQITPNTWYVSGNSNQYYSPQEREYYLNDGQEAIEIVVNYDHYTQYPSGYVYLFPAIYDDHSGAPINLSLYEDPGEGIMQLNPGTFPHAYGYHVQIYNGKYYIVFQDMNDLSWFHEYVYNDQDNPSTTFTRASGSVEFWQGSNPITDTFYAYTTPVIDEWAHEVPILGSASWKKPSSVWSLNQQTANENFVHISWAWGGSNNQDLITNSYLWSGWA